MSRFKVAAVQMDSGDNREKNLQTVRRLTDEAVQQGAKLIVLPETVDYTGRDLAGHAVEIPGWISSFFSNLAKEYGIYLHCGSITQRQEDGKPKNTSLLYGPDGEEIARYSKLHMFDVQVEDGPSYCESKRIQAGEEIALARTKLCDLGLSICYDLRFGEMYRLMALHGAWLLAVPANFTRHTGELHWETLLRARAIENSCYVVAADQTGTKGRFQAYGNSMIIDPMGNILARAGEEEGVILAEVDSVVLRETREQIPSLHNRREDIYLLAEKQLRIYEEKV